MKSAVEIIQDLYGFLAEKNLEAVRLLFAETISWEQMKGFPGGGHYRGFDEIVEKVFGVFGEKWINWEAHVEEMKSSGNTVFVQGYYSGTYKSTGKSVKAVFIHRYDLKEGKIQEFKQFADTQLIAAAMGK
jgi:ketosteroid isomerase-like protein